MTLAAGTLVGPYRIVELLGAGGVGEVYRVRDPRLDRDVALKFLHEEYSADPMEAARFTREAKLAASLRHTNIIVIHDVGVHEGRPFLVMELLEGTTLRHRLGGRALPAAELVKLGTQIARALEAAHAKQIVHRDLKPENVFVLPDDQIKILDFGLAIQEEEIHTEKLFDFDSGRTILRTRAGSVLGTAGYMAPEQVRGLAVDVRADIFAFGAILYEMATGRKAFVRESVADSLVAVLTDEPDGLTEANPDAALAEPLASLVRRCLHKAPRERLQSISEVLAELEKLDDRPNAAAPAQRRESRASLAVLPFADISAAKDHEYFCDGVCEEITSALARLPGLRIASRTSAFQFRERTKDIRAIAAALGVDTVLEGSVRSAKDRVRIGVQLVNAADGYQIWADTYDRRLDDIFAVQEEIARKVVSSLQVSLALPSEPLVATAPADVRAYTLYLRGRHHWNRRTEEGFRKAIAAYREALAVDPAYAQAHAGLAEAELSLGLYGIEPAGNSMPAARASAEAALALSKNRAHVQAVLGCAQAVYDWQWEEAEATFARAIALDPQDAAAYHWLAIMVQTPRRRFVEAQAALKHAIAIDPLSLVFNTTAGMIAYFAGDFPHACTLIMAALELDRTFALAHLFLGQALAETGAFDRALDHLQIANRVSGESPEARAALASVAARAGESAIAREELAALQALSASRYLSPSLIAQVHVGLGETAEALAALEQAYRLKAADLPWLVVRPVFAPLRHEPRFSALVTGMGLG